ncbi:MAG: dienelactone hydrolase [Patiriisocius sp.]|jgi:dienelactone hydrolase
MNLKFVSLFFIVILLSFQAFSQDCAGISLSSIMIPGQYNIGVITEDDGLRDGPDYFEGTLSYPIGVDGPLASIAITTGFFSDEADIADWGPFLASHGFIAFTIGTNSYLDFPTERAYGLLDALESIRQENDRIGSPLFGKVDDERMAVGGWSMGGGGAQYAAVIDTSLKAVVALCPWLNSNGPEDLNHPVALLIMSAENDGTAPVNSHANIHYASTPEATDKMLFEVANGDHSVNNEPTGAMGDAGRIAVAWLRAHLLDDPCYCPLTEDPVSTASSYLTSFECATPGGILFNLKTFLQGPYDVGFMNDGLRSGNHIPLQEPYSSLGFTITENSGALIASSVLDVTGSDAIVDWIIVELRDGIVPSAVLGSQVALLQSDGDIVSLDGITPVLFTDIMSPNFNIAIRHRNHLGMRTLNTYSGENISIDYSDVNLPLFGVTAMHEENGVRMMYAGNANYDQQINSIDKNGYWRIQNANQYDYFTTNSDFDMNGAINSVDKNLYWRMNNSVFESLD